MVTRRRGMHKRRRKMHNKLQSTRKNYCRRITRKMHAKNQKGGVYFHNKAKYNLLGVNLHQEFGYSGTNSGHYTSLLKNRFDNNWYRFNDGNKPQQIAKMDDLQNSNAYLLFYYRV